MAITVTTLSAAITALQTTFAVASATGITAPNNQTGAGITWLQIDQEIMPVTAIAGTAVSVQRGWHGTQAVAHLANSQVQIGLPSDYPLVQRGSKNVQESQTTFASRVQPGQFLAGLTDAIPTAIPGFYVIKSAAADLMTLAAPTAAQEGFIIDVWSDALFAHTITATALLANGTALKTTATFAAFRGAGITLRACNLVWHVLQASAVTLT